MSSTTTFPVTIDPEAAAHVANLGYQAEFERMIDHAWQTIPGLSSLAVVLDQPFDDGDDPRIILEANQDITWHPDDATWQDWSHWIVATFSPDVWRHFQLLNFHGHDNAR